MCFVRLVSDVPGSVCAKLRDPPLVFHFHFAVLVDHGACSVKHVAADEK